MTNNNDPQLKNSKMLWNCGRYLVFRSQNAQTHFHASSEPNNFCRKTETSPKDAFSILKRLPLNFTAHLKDLKKPCQCRKHFQTCAQNNSLLLKAARDLKILVCLNLKPYLGKW